MDKNLRWAITYAINYDACREVVKAPASELLIGPIYKRDLKKAMEYKNKSSYAGKQVTLVMNLIAGTENHRKLGLIVNDNLKDIGINLDLRTRTWNTIAKELFADPRECSFDIYPYYAASQFYDPYGTIFKVLHSKSLVGAPNLGYSNPKFDAILDQAARTIDRKERMALYKKAGQLPVEDATYVWLYMVPFFVIHRDSVKVHAYGHLGDAVGNMISYYDLYRE